MANHEINEEQEAVNKALRMIETSDPVHADVYNALFSILINNDVFLEKLANKMVQQVMISHVMDSTNPDMVMGADQGPVITKLIEKVREQVNVLNTKRKISDISYIKSSEDVGIERFYLTQHGAVVTMTFSFVLKKSIPQGAYENVIIGYLPSDIKPVQETWPLMGEQGSNKSHQGRVKSNGQIELWCWGADALDKDHIFSCTAVFLVNT
ncbi:MAG: hypothetical protein KHY39_00835 [Clostridiaceae bacterium]|nr:hypothetical protein [Clostridiaceae bacterium]